jgi:hypothetical protein
MCAGIANLAYRSRPHSTPGLAGFLGVCPRQLKQNSDSDTLLLPKVNTKPAEPETPPLQLILCRLATNSYTPDPTLMAMIDNLYRQQRMWCDSNLQGTSVVRPPRHSWLLLALLFLFRDLGGEIFRSESRACKWKSHISRLARSLTGCQRRRHHRCHPFQSCIKTGCGFSDQRSPPASNSSTLVQDSISMPSSDYGISSCA